MQRIGIIGEKGFVGTACRCGFVHCFDVYCYDKKEPNLVNFYHGESLPPTVVETDNPISYILNNTDGPIFVSVPTPMLKNGKCDTSIVESILDEIEAIAENPVVVIIKSTIVPGTTERLNGKYKKIECVYNPEFLREASFIEDFKKQDRIIIGGPHSATAVVKQMYQIAYPNVPTTKTSSTIAEMVKYVTNCFLATKVSFSNEMFQICEKLGVDWDKVAEYIVQDKRLGTSHWAVPGPMPDAKGNLRRGFSGSCFVKDLNALMYLAKELGVDPKVMDGAWQQNLFVRPDRDWEELKGRAVNF